MIREITGRVLHHAHANSPEDFGAPERQSALASMLRALDLRPVGRAKRDGGHVHELRVSFNVSLVVVQNRLPSALLLFVGGRRLRRKCLDDPGLAIFLVELDDGLPFISKRVLDSLETTYLGVLAGEVKAHGSVLGLHAIAELPADSEVVLGS